MSVLSATFIVALQTMLTCNYVIGQGVESVCAHMPSSQDLNHTMPRFSDHFSVDIEAKFVERNMTMYIREHYDKLANRGQLTIKKPNSGDKLYYMDYDTNNLLLVDADSSSCQVSQISTTKDSFIFGYRNESGLARMNSPSGAFHFGNVDQIYNGSWEVRGIPCDVWVSCQYIDVLQASAQVVWYISRKEAWDMQMGVQTTPLRMVANGVQVTQQNTQVKFSHIYDFFNYEQSVNPSDLVVPDGVYCPNRVTPDNKPFPQVPNVFYFIGEIIDPYKNQFTYLEEAYDNVTRVSLFRFKGDVTTLTSMDQFLALNDYNTGVSYLLNTVAGTCFPSPLKDGFMSYSVSINGQKVRMKTPKEFLMDSNIQYQYAGATAIRQIPCERWVATTTTATGYNGTLVVLEWYFAAGDQVTWNTGATAANYRMPVLFRLYIPGTLSAQGYDFHIYYFNVVDSLAPISNGLDISPCFSGAHVKNVRFRFNKANETVLRNNILNSVMSIKNGISLATGISPLRINNVNLYFNPDYVWVTFDLLDKAPQYNDVATNDQENSLDDAWQLFDDSFASKKMTFFFAAGTQLNQLTPEWDSLEVVVNGQVQGSSNPYSTGALAGIGVAMLIVGGAAGGGGGFFLFLRHQ